MEHIKNIVVRLLNRAVRFYIDRNKLHIVAVAGSIGKTSTANAIRTVLAQNYRVHQPLTAYNTTKSIHVELFDLPFATSTVGWLRTVPLVLWKSLGRAPYDIAVIEIGTDHPGELRTFAWLKPDVGVLTAITPEHMEYFGTIDAVAKEELSIEEFCSNLIFNINAVDRDHMSVELADRVLWYGTGTEYSASNYQLKHNHVLADFIIGDERLDSLELKVLGEHSLDALVAAAAVGSRFGLNLSALAAGLREAEPVKGRMRRFAGIQASTIIDDTYNSSPRAAKAALDVLRQFETSQRIAVLGTMNEMGDYSEQAHREVGDYCRPDYIEQVVTIGHDANEYLAAAAEANGCKVKRFDDPYEAGTYIHKHLKQGAVILCKGSQNGVFAEETVKLLLADPADAINLVRQSDYWLERKRQQFIEQPA
jgi:UDP-N-acetylmuramoyl-tripeptide--D-alanyl-D-alanine ligase